MKAFVMDYWSDHNRGDAAMQVSLLELLKKYSQGVQITVCTEYGFNQQDDLLSELDEVGPKGLADRIMGGVRRTAYPIGKASSLSLSQRRMRKIFDFVDGVLVLSLVLVVGRGAGIFFSGRRAAVFNELRRAEFVVWNGRNFRSRSTSTELYDLWSLLFNPMVAIRLKKPMYAIGVSCWELKTGVGRSWLRFVLSKCKYISARENPTLEQLRVILSTKEFDSLVRREPDLSFYYLSKVRGQVRPLSKRGGRFKVALTLVDWGESDGQDKERYIDALTGLVSGICVDRQVEIRVVPQVPYGPQSYSSVLSELERRVRDEVESFSVIDHKLSLDQLVEEYRNVDLLVGTRMHSVIFAWSVGTPALAISYDTGAKWGILEDIGVKDYLCGISEVDSEKLTRLYHQLENDPLESVSARVSDLCSRVENNVSSWLPELGLINRDGC